MHEPICSQKNAGQLLCLEHSNASQRIMIAATETSRSSLSRKNFPGTALLAAGALALFSILIASAAPFTAGDIAVLRVGDSTVGPLSSVSTNVFIDEYTTNGTFVQTIAV